MNRGGFAVHIGHVRKGALLLRQRLIGAAGHGLLREGERLRIDGEGARIAPEQIARKLVEHDDFRQPTQRRRSPRKQFTAQRLAMKCTKTRAQQRVESRIGFEPLRGLDFAEPAIEDGIGREVSFGLSCREPSVRPTQPVFEHPGVVDLRVVRSEQQGDAPCPQRFAQGLQGRRVTRQGIEFGRVAV